MHLGAAILKLDAVRFVAQVAASSSCQNEAGSAPLYIVSCFVW